MAWRKSPDALIDRFYAALPDAPEVERRKMFGYPCAFVNGNMFAGLHQEDMILRLPDADRAALAAMPGGGAFEPMPGRPMKEYVKVPPALVEDRRALSDWTARAHAHIAAMPPKVKKPRKAKKQA
jgi:TfoX/Sxy family transcriptional regulator of competence genes